VWSAKELFLDELVFNLLECGYVLRVLRPYIVTQFCSGLGKVRIYWAFWDVDYNLGCYRIGCCTLLSSYVAYMFQIRFAITLCLSILWTGCVTTYRNYKDVTLNYALSIVFINIFGSIPY
jgi:hypothetical protein